MAKQSESVSKVRTKLTEFLSVKQETLISRTQWGDINFADAKDDIDAIYSIVHILNGLPLEKLPANAGNEIFAALNSAFDWISRIDKFTLHQPGGPVEHRNQILTNLPSMQESLYRSTHQWIPFLAYLKGDIPAQLDAISSSVRNAETTDSDFTKYVAEKKSAIDAAVSAAREASAKAGAAHFTQDFLSDAGDREDAASNWLRAAATAAAITVGVAVGFFWVAAPVGVYAVAQFTTSKIVILAMLIGATAWCAGNYRANKHQATVSRHKGHSLKTFQAFVQASDSPDIKDAVLLETTRSIFAHAASGYLKNETSGDAAPRVTEILRATGVARVNPE